MNKKEFQIQFEKSNISNEEAEKRLFLALSMILNIEYLYEEENTLSKLLLDKR